MNIELIDFEILGDERGLLVSLESNRNIPMDIKRVYYIFGTKEGVVRGLHAHKKLNQIAICLRGSCRFLLDDGKEKKSLLLDTPHKGLLIEKMVWHEMSEFSEDCVLMVVTHEYYDESDYIRDYSEFKKLVDSGVAVA